MPADIPPAIREKVVCSIAAAAKYGVPANIILAVAQREGGRPGQWVRNNNATYDIGSMQFNTAYVRSLARYGIGTADVAKAGCFSFDLAAWRLRGHIKNDGGDVWTRVANYHSRTPRYNAPYRASIMVMAGQWERWLGSRFNTYDTLTGTGRTIAVVATAPVTQAPVRASKPNPYSLPVRMASVRGRAAARRDRASANLAPFSSPIRVAFDPGGYVPRTIGVAE